MAATKNPIPAELKRKVSASLFMLVDGQTFFTIVGFGLTLLGIYGPLVGPPDHNGFRYLLGPLVFPSVTAVYYTCFPFRPYRGTPFVLAGKRDIDIRDQGVMCLVELYKSQSARRFLWRTAMKMSGPLFLIMVIITFLVRRSLNWSISSPWLFGGSFLGLVGSYMVVATYYIAWGLRNWVSFHCVNQPVD